MVIRTTLRLPSPEELGTEFSAGRDKKGGTFNYPAGRISVLNGWYGYCVQRQDQSLLYIVHNGLALFFGSARESGSMNWTGP